MDTLTTLGTMEDLREPINCSMNHGGLPPLPSVGYQDGFKNTPAHGWGRSATWTLPSPSLPLTSSVPHTGHAPSLQRAFVFDVPLA